MNQIKFSHEYLKFPKGFKWGNSYRLLHVFLEDSKNLRKDFLDYDTIYSEGEELKHFKLPVGLVLVLLFESDNGCFTTIRRWTAEKTEYYKGAVGAFFEFVKLEE